MEKNLLIDETVSAIDQSGHAIVDVVYIEVDGESRDWDEFAKIINYKSIGDRPVFIWFRDGSSMTWNDEFIGWGWSWSRPIPS